MEELFVHPGRSKMGTLLAVVAKESGVLAVVRQGRSICSLEVW